MNYTPKIRTEFVGRPMTTLNAIRKGGTFLAVAPKGLKAIQVSIDQTAVIAAPFSCSIEKLAKKARAMGLSDATHTIYQVITREFRAYTYSIDNN